MSKVDIISQQWCDLVFEGRNKSYGAYDLRSKAGRRHLLAIIDILVGIAALAALIFSYTAAKKAYDASMGADAQAVTELSELKKDEPKKEEKKAEVKQEEEKPKEQIQKVAVRASIGFTVPEIVDKVDETKKLKNQDELNRSNISIASQDYGGDTKNGMNIDDLKDNQRAGGDQVPTTKEEKKLLRCTPSLSRCRSSPVVKTRCSLMWAVTSSTPRSQRNKIYKVSSSSVSSFSRTVASATCKSSSPSNRIATLKPSAW